MFLTQMKDHFISGTSQKEHSVKHFPWFMDQRNQNKNKLTVMHKPFEQEASVFSD